MVCFLAFQRLNVATTDYSHAVIAEGLLRLPGDIRYVLSKHLRTDLSNKMQLILRMYLRCVKRLFAFEVRILN